VLESVAAHHLEFLLTNNTSVVYVLSTHALYLLSNVKSIYRQRCMSRVLIGGAGGRRNVRPCRMQQRTVQFSDVPWKWHTVSYSILTFSRGLAVPTLTRFCHLRSMIWYDMIQQLIHNTHWSFSHHYGLDCKMPMCTV